MIENDYPIPSYMADVFDKPDGWVETQAVFRIHIASSTRKIKLAGIRRRLRDEDGKELTRVCIIDYESGIVVYDKLVKPPKPVIDYLTKYRFPSRPLDARTPPTI
jgi:RNA exonuclease 1